jgi:hypothetical protein
VTADLRPVLLVLLMLWQTLAWVTPFAIEVKGEQIAHLKVHQQERDHHHHDDPALQLASDADSGLHFHADDGFQPPGLDASIEAIGFGALPEAAPSARSAAPSSVFPDRLLRPPSARA